METNRTNMNDLIKIQKTLDVNKLLEYLQKHVIGDRDTLWAYKVWEIFTDIVSSNVRNESFKVYVVAEEEEYLPWYIKDDAKRIELLKEFHQLYMMHCDVDRNEPVLFLFVW